MSDLEGEFLPLGTVSLENVSLAELEEATTKFNKDGNNLYQIGILSYYLHFDWC